MIADYYNDLNHVINESWQLIELGVSNRRHGFHNPVAATIGLDGRPRARTVILRSANKTDRKIVFHSDARSEKISELQADSRISMHFYDVNSKVQVRIEGVVELHTENEFARQRWDLSQKMSRMCYSVQPAPGTKIEHGNDYAMHDVKTVLPEDQEHDFKNFTAVEIHVSSLEWLFLALEGHRRAYFKWDKANLREQTWLVP